MPESFEKPVILAVKVGNAGRTYAGGDFLNAVDEVASYFINQREIDGPQLASALIVYVEHLREECR